MENDNPRSSTDNGFLKDDVSSFGFQDFDFDENHIWCEQCKRLKQELKKLQDEHALNYSTLKKKIISTDLLIKKYKGKCDDYDAQTKKYEDFFRKYEDLQRESETLNAQLGSTLQQLEPLKKAKEALEVDSRQKQNRIEDLQSKVVSCELAVRQYEEVSKESFTFKDRFDSLKKEKNRKLQSLETINQKNEAQISKLRDENKNLRSENTVQLRKQRKLEGRIKKAVDRVERYWAILKLNGLLPRGEKKLPIERYLDINGDISVSQDEEDTVQEDEKMGSNGSEGDDDDDDFVEPGMDEDKTFESEKFPWIFSPLAQALSPLPPSPMPCRMNKPLMTKIGCESDEENIDEMANLLESELLRVSPACSPLKSQSLLRKIQTRSPLVERKPKQKVKMIEAVTKDIKSSKNSGLLLDFGGESLSDSDNENIESSIVMGTLNKNIVTVDEKCEVETLESGHNSQIDSMGDNSYNIIKLNEIGETGNITSKSKVLDKVITIDEKGDNKGSKSENKVSAMKPDNVMDHKIERSEHSAFKKITPKSVTKLNHEHTENTGVDISLCETVCLEAYPNDTIVPDKNLSEDAADLQRKEDSEIISDFNKRGTNEKQNISSARSDFTGETCESNEKKRNTLGSDLSYVKKLIKSRTAENTSRKIEFIDEVVKSKEKLEIKSSQNENLKNSNEDKQSSDVDGRGDEKGDSLQNESAVNDEKKDNFSKNKSLGSTFDNNKRSMIDNNRMVLHESENKTERFEERKDSDDTGFDLDNLEYDNVDTGESYTREICETPKLDDNQFIAQNAAEKVTMQNDNSVKVDGENKNLDSPMQNLSKDADTKSYQNRVILSSSDKEQCSNKPQNNMIRQFSSGFVVRSPPFEQEKKTLTSNSRNSEGKNKSVPIVENFNTQNAKILKAKSIDKHKNKNIPNFALQEMNRKNENIPNLAAQKIDSSFVEESVCSDKVLIHQGSLGFIVDSEETCENETSLGATSVSETIPKDDRKISDIDINKFNKTEVSKENSKQSSTNVSESFNTCSKNAHKTNVTDSYSSVNDENFLTKQKYLSFVESRRSSTDSIVSRRLSQDSLDNGERLSLSTKNIELKSSDNTVRKGTLMNKKTSVVEEIIGCEKSQGWKALQKERKCDLKKEGTDKTNSILASSHRNKLGNDKSLHQLVLHSLGSNTVPSSAVISPEVSDLTKHFDMRPKSQNSLHSASPLSPLPISPFDFCLPMPISPLPPSPVRRKSPLSPLPGSPLIEEVLMEPVLEVKPVKPKKRRSRPCSFSSVVPSHAIQVMPLNTCKIPPVPTKPQVKRPEPAVPAERDPLAIGKKQRISRVQHQPTAQKRKSLEPVACDSNDKKKCTESKPTESHEHVPVKQETGYWKDVEIFMQQYICLYNMTPEELTDKLMKDRDPQAILPAVIIWATQYLRTSEYEMLNIIYQFCKGEKEVKPGPFLTTQESRLVDFFVYIIHKELWNEFRTRLFDALWNCIMLKDVVTVLGRVSLCRVFTALCQKEGNVNNVRVLLYNAMTRGYLKFVTLGLAMVGVWPQVLCKSVSEPSRLLATIEFCFMKLLLVDKDKYEKVICCFTTLCNWTVPARLDAVVVLKHLVQDLNNVTRYDEGNSIVSDKQFELAKSLDLLLLTEDIMFFKKSFMVCCLNQMFQKIKSNSQLMNGGLPAMYIKHIIHVTASALSMKADNKFATRTVKKFMCGLLSLATVSTEIKEAVANSLSDIAFIAPVPIFANLNDWFKKEQKSVPPGLKQKMENSRLQLLQFEGKLTSYSFK